MEGEYLFKICEKCKEKKPWSSYGKNKNARYGLARYCKECTKIIGQDYRLRRGIASAGFSGVVYLFGLKDTDYFKVGITNDVLSRMRALQTANPHEIYLISSFESNDCLNVERKIHGLLYSMHVHGEWFKGNLDTVLDVFQSLLSEEDR